MGSLTESLTLEILTLFREASRSCARTSAQPEKAQELTENAADSGEKWLVWFAKWDHATSSWRTRHYSLFGGLEEFSGIWPRWGTMQNGECSELETLVPPTDEIESGLWPTPSGVKGAGHCVGAISEWGGNSNPFRGTSDRNLRCPDFEEWMMGLPESWTALTPYETARFQAWLDSHGISSQEPKP